MSIPHSHLRAKIILPASLFTILAVTWSAPAPLACSARAEEIGGQKYQEPQHASPLVPQGKQQQSGPVQKQGAQFPPPGTYTCLNQPKASQNTQTLSSANPLPEKAGSLLGKPVYGKTGGHVGDVQAEVTPQGCNITAVLVGIHGFIGIGGKQIEIPMQELKQEGDKLVATTMSAQEIRNLKPVTARNDTDRNVPR
jgi:sporulation protein YlmC with PRC-barrel domain